MINKDKAKRFCCEDFSLIENYDKAVADKEQVWHCHHRLELGDNGEVNSMQVLKRRGMYYGRPANELIFLTEHDHRSLHGHHMSKGTLELISRTSTGRTHTEETKRRISETKKKRHPLRGKQMPEEWKQHIAEGLKGRVFSDEHRRKLSEAAKRRYAKNSDPTISSSPNACQSNS